MGGFRSDERKQDRTYQAECSLRRNQHEGDSSMQRRDFIKSVAAAGIIGTGGRGAHTAETGWRQFEITYRINIKDSASDTDVRLWVPVPQDALDYQRVLDLSWRSPVATHVLWEATSRAPIVSATWTDPKIAREIVITAQVATRDRSGFYPDASHDELAECLKPTASSPNDGIVLAKAREIVGTRTAPLDKARAIYDWIVDNTFRRAETRGCGLGNIVFMLESGDLGGKCADINRHSPDSRGFGARIVPLTGSGNDKSCSVQRRAIEARG